MLDLEVLKDLEGHSQWRTKRFNKGKLSYLAVPRSPSRGPAI